MWIGKRLADSVHFQTKDYSSYSKYCNQLKNLKIYSRNGLKGKHLQKQQLRYFDGINRMLRRRIRLYFWENDIEFVFSFCCFVFDKKEVFKRNFIMH